MALTPYVSSYSFLKSYIKEELGSPVIRIEVTEKQLENQINKALEEFVENAEGGVDLRFTELTTIPGTQDYTLPFEVHAVLRVFGDNNSGWISVFPEKAVADMYGSKLPPSGDLISLEFARHYLDTLEFLIQTQPRFDFNPVSRVLHLYEEPQTSNIGYVYYRKLDYTSDSNIYNNIWVKEYATALTRLQWGRNLQKFSGTMLPGGITQNADAILSEAKEDIERLRLDLVEKYSQPTDFFHG